MFTVKEVVCYLIASSQELCKEVGCVLFQGIGENKRNTAASYVHSFLSLSKIHLYNIFHFLIYCSVP